MEGETHNGVGHEINSQELDVDSKETMDIQKSVELKEVSEADRVEAIKNAEELAEEIDELAGDTSLENQGALARIATILKNPVEQLRVFLGRSVETLPVVESEELREAKDRLVKFEGEPTPNEIRLGMVELIQKLNFFKDVDQKITDTIRSQLFIRDIYYKDARRLGLDIKRMIASSGYKIKDPDNAPLYEQLMRFSEAYLSIHLSEPVLKTDVSFEGKTPKEISKYAGDLAVEFGIVPDERIMRQYQDAVHDFEFHKKRTGKYVHTPQMKSGIKRLDAELDFQKSKESSEKHKERQIV